MSKLNELIAELCPNGVEYKTLGELGSFMGGLSGKKKDDFEIMLEKVLSTDCTISFDKHTLYNKTYNNSAIKNETTLVLLVVIGSGGGSNWWGTVYPEFLDISSSEEVKYESLIVNLFRKIR